MSSVNPMVIGAGVLALIGLIAIWRTGRRGAQRAATEVREVTRMGGMFARTLVIAAVIVGVQWAVVAYSADRATLAVVLGVPALLAGVTVARLFAVTTVIQTGRKGVRR